MKLILLLDKISIITWQNVFVVFEVIQGIKLPLLDMNDCRKKILELSLLVID